MLLWMNRSVDLEQTFINNLEWLICSEYACAIFRDSLCCGHHYWATSSALRRFVRELKQDQKHQRAHAVPRYYCFLPIQWPESNTLFLAHVEVELLWSFEKNNPACVFIHYMLRYKWFETLFTSFYIFYLIFEYVVIVWWSEVVELTLAQWEKGQSKGLMVREPIRFETTTIALTLW